VGSYANKLVECRQAIPHRAPRLLVLRVLANVASWIPHGCRTTWSAYTLHTIQDFVIPTSRSRVAALLLCAHKRAHMKHTTAHTYIRQRGTCVPNIYMGILCLNGKNKQIHITTRPSYVAMYIHIPHESCHT